MRRFALFTTLTLFACALVAARGLRAPGRGRQPARRRWRSSTSAARRSSRGPTSACRARSRADARRAARLCGRERVDRGAPDARSTSRPRGRARSPLPAGARGVALAPDGSRAYVTSGGRAGRRHGRRPRTGGIVAGEIATSKRPAAIALSPDGSRAYVVCGTRKLALVDLVGLRTVKTIRVGRNPFSVAVDTSGARVYVTNAGGRSVRSSTRCGSRSRA